ncbi:hypothetical protein FJ936_13465 [Mesorhizobium sp. B2-4-13]|uniref:hypothetical protein n=1 Tax=Mesorhizobium sp. B2-4-13 TaxID=2589936 RepID=UPI00114FA64E|nr:hypothetical protein [Mesorhizobium sp. B2-4-13]TPK84880.1 hypothetical protein FJ936_13465 [Mesorhizobium sp. B2-4-13]
MTAFGQENVVRDVSPPGAVGPVSPGTTVGEIPPAPAPAPSDIEKELTALIADLEAKGADGISSTKLIKLIDLLQGLANKADRPDPDTDEIKAFTKKIVALNTKDGARPGDAYAAALSALADEADRFLIKQDAANALKRLVAQVKAAATNPKDPKAVTEQISTLVANSLTAWQNDLVNKIKMLSAAILAELGTEKTLAANLKMLANDEKAGEVIKTLSTTIMPVAVAAERHVHIVSAIYGDRRTINQVLARGKKAVPGSLDRWCNATAVMRTQCENKPDCKAPGNMPASLCGYDPVPFVLPQYKVAVVFYRCLASNVAENWSGVTANLGRDNAFVPADERANFSVSLANENQIFYCTAPK